MNNFEFDLSMIPLASGRTKAFIELWRRWWDSSEPDHNIHLSTRARKSGSLLRFVMLRVVYQGQSVVIRQWDCHTFDGRYVDTYKSIARELRDSLPSELFAAARRNNGTVDVPGISKNKHGSYRVTSQGMSKTFGRRYTDPYGDAVKFLFDRLGVWYPENCFDEVKGEV